MSDKGYLKYIILERYLNRIKFLGIPMGGTLADQLALNKMHGVQPLRNTVKGFLWESYILILSRFRKKPLVFNTPVIATWVADKHHFNNMITPLIEYFQKDVTVIFNPEIKRIKQYRAHFVSIKETYLTPSKFLPGLFYFLTMVIYLLSKKRKRLKLNTREILFYALRLFHQARIIAFYDYQFKNSLKCFRIVVTEYDRNGIAAPLILSAKKNGIKTITLVHGVMENYGFTPVLADFIFCFGEIQRDQLTEQNVPPEKIKITGTSIIPEFKDFERRQRPDGQILRICLGISPIRKIHLKSMIETVIEAISDYRFIELTIKLHPSQAKEDFIHYQENNERVKILSSREIDNLDLFREMDYLIINFSGLGIEAMYQKVPVVLMKTHKGETGLVDLMVKWSTLPVFETSGELHSILSRIMTDSKFSDDLSKKGKTFADKYYYATGSKAAQNIIDELIEIANL